MAKEEKKEEAPAAKPEPSPEESAAKSKKRKLIIIVAGGVVLTAAIGGGLAFFMAGGGDAQMAAKPGVEQPAPDAAASAKPAEAAAPDKGAAPADAKAAAGGEAKEGAAPAAAATAAPGSNVDFGCTTTFQPFHLNLGNPLENRYVRLEIAVEFGCSEELKAEIDKRLPQLRDAVISVTSRKTREFLLGPDGKEQLRKEIHTRINHYMSRKVDDVYITDILIE
jgi:flagellar FliL protein